MVGVLLAAGPKVRKNTAGGLTIMTCLSPAKKRTDTNDKHPLVFLIMDDSGQGIGLIHFLLHPNKSVARESGEPGLLAESLIEEGGVIFV